jgi:hypothetical protein
VRSNNSSIDIGVTANKNMFSNNVQTLSGHPRSLRGVLVVFDIMDVPNIHQGRSINFHISTLLGTLGEGGTNKM